MSRLRVLLDMTWATGQGGTARYVRSLRDALEADPHVEVIAVSAPRLMGGPRFSRLPVNGALHLLWTQGVLPVLSIVNRADVVQATMTAPVLSPRPVVLTLHDALDFMPALRPSRVWSGYMRTVGAVAARRAAAVLTGTQASAEEIVSCYGVAPERVRVTAYGSALAGLPSGKARTCSPFILSRSEGSLYVSDAHALVDSRPLSSWFTARSSRPGDPSLRLRMKGEQVRASSDEVADPASDGRSLDGDVFPFVLMVGAADRRKDIETGLRAVEMLREEGVEIEAIVVGGVPDTFKDVGWVEAGMGVSDRDLTWLYQRAVAVLVPSRHEGYGLPVVEGLGFGTPVVASDLPALREVGGDAAFYAPVGDAEAFARHLRWIVEHPENAHQRLRQSGANVVTWTSTAQATVAVYRTLLERAR